MKLDTTNLKVPNGTKLFSDNLPRLTHGGFVGSAKIDPRYALKVKNEDICVDIRDFFPAYSASRDARRRIAENTSNMIRRQCFARKMAKSANVPSGETFLSTPNATLNAQVSEVRNHLIGTTKEDFSDVEDKILTACTVQVVDSVTEGGVKSYTTYEVDPMKCNLVGFNTSPSKNWIEQNNVYLSVPTDVALAALPAHRRAAYEAFRSQFPNGGLIAPISGNDIMAPFDRGFTSCFSAAAKIDPFNNFFTCAPITSCVMSIAPGDAKPFSQKFFVIEDISDLISAIQDPRLTSSNSWWDSLKKVITPITQTVVQVVDTFMDTDRVSRNGYSLRDMENVVYCKNFAAVCRDFGFEDIPTMLDTMMREKKGSSNFIDLLFQAIPTVVDLVTSLFDAPKNSPKVLEEGEVDYSQGGYPFAPGEVSVLSRSTSGIGASGTLGVVTPFPPNNAGSSDPKEEMAPVVESMGTYSVGNSIPRSIYWEISQYFKDIGGTPDNVGTYLRYSAFDFSRINVFLTDSIGFVTPCDTDVVSVHNFDSTMIGRGVAVIEIAVQGSTVLTVPFPYEIVETPIVACLTRIVPTDVLIGTKIDKHWIVNVVCDSDIGEVSEYKNICTLTCEGFDVDPVDTHTPGWKDITVRPKNTATAIETHVRVNVVQPSLESVQDYRDHYDLQAYLAPSQAPNPGVVIQPRDIVVKANSIGSGLPFFSGTAQDLMDIGFVSSITLNGSEDLTLVEGNNKFVFMSKLVGDVATVTGHFTEKVVREVAEIDFTPKQESPLSICYAASDVVSGTALKSEYFGCELLYSDGGHLPIQSENFKLDDVYPPVYSADGVIGEVRVRPIDIAEYDTLVLSGRPPQTIVYASDDPKYIGKPGIITSATFTSSRLPWVGEYPNPEDFTVIAEWTADTGDKVQHTLHHSSYAVVAKNSATQETTPKFTADSDSALVKWGDQTYTVPVSVGKRDGAPIVLGSIEAVPRKGKSLTVSYGTRLHPTHFEVTAVSADGEYRKTLEHALHIGGYYPMFSGKQNVVLSYGLETGAKTATLQVRVKEPEIVKVVVTPVSTNFDMGDELSPSDLVVTAVTADGMDLRIPPSQIRVSSFGTGFIGDQTFMGTIETVGFEGGTETGSFHASSFRYDVGLGGDDTRFTTPALVCSFTKPYCFVGDRVEGISDLGFSGAFIIASDGSRIAVEDPEHLSLGEVDTSAPGMVFVGVEYAPVE